MLRKFSKLYLPELGRHQLVKLGIAGELVYKRHKRAADLEKPLSCADINKLTGTDSIATREIGNEDKGRHTSTHRELIQLPNGAFVIDTPGMR